MPLFRRLHERLAQHMENLTPDGYLAGLGPAKFAIGAYDVAKLKELREFPLVGDVRLAQAYLYISGRISDGEEYQFADVTQQNDAPGAAGLLAFCTVDEPGLDAKSRFDVVESTAIRVYAESLDLLELFVPLLFQAAGAFVGQFTIL
jgi:hypothetical protein